MFKMSKTIDYQKLILTKKSFLKFKCIKENQKILDTNQIFFLPWKVAKISAISYLLVFVFFLYFVSGTICVCSILCDFFGVVKFSCKFLVTHAVRNYEHIFIVMAERAKVPGDGWVFIAHILKYVLFKFVFDNMTYIVVV